MTDPLPLVKDLAVISLAADHRLQENEAFRDFIRNYPGDVDGMVQEINKSVEPFIDCTSCGNCCRSLMINVSEEEILPLAQHLQRNPEEVKAAYLEESQGGQFVINTIPCHFLEDNKCSVYEYRFEGCRAFPHLDEPGFSKRMFGLLMHYGRCPIIFNVIEELKHRTKFVIEINQLPL